MELTCLNLQHTELFGSVWFIVRQYYIRHCRQNKIGCICMIYKCFTHKLYEMHPAQPLLAEAINEHHISFKALLVGSWEVPTWCFYPQPQMVLGTLLLSAGSWRMSGRLLKGNSFRYVLEEVICISLALRNLGSPRSLKLALLIFLQHLPWLAGVSGFHFTPLSPNPCLICRIQEETSHLENCILKTPVFARK